MTQFYEIDCDELDFPNLTTINDLPNEILYKINKYKIQLEKAQEKAQEKAHEKVFIELLNQLYNMKSIPYGWAKETHIPEELLCNKTKCMSIDEFLNNCLVCAQEYGEGYLELPWNELERTNNYFSNAKDKRESILLSVIENLVRYDDWITFNNVMDIKQGYCEETDYDIKYELPIIKPDRKRVKKVPENVIEYLNYVKDNCFQVEFDDNRFWHDAINTNDFYIKTMELKSKYKPFMELKKCIKRNTTKVDTDDGIFYDMFGGEDIFKIIEKILE